MEGKTVEDLFQILKPLEQHKKMKALARQAEDLSMQIVHGKTRRPKRTAKIFDLSARTRKTGQDSKQTIAA